MLVPFNLKKHRGLPILTYQLNGTGQTVLTLADVEPEEASKHPRLYFVSEDETATKHLPGAHDQMAHGNWARDVVIQEPLVSMGLGTVDKKVRSLFRRDKHGIAVPNLRSLDTLRNSGQYKQADTVEKYEYLHHEMMLDILDQYSEQELRNIEKIGSQAQKAGLFNPNSEGWGPIVPNQGTILGYYNPDTKQLHLNPNMAGRSMIESVFAHEVGHSMDFDNNGVASMKIRGLLEEIEYVLDQGIASQRRMSPGVQRGMEDSYAMDKAMVGYGKELQDLLTKCGLNDYARSDSREFTASIYALWKSGTSDEKAALDTLLSRPKTVYRYSHPHPKDEVFTLDEFVQKYLIKKV